MAGSEDFVRGFSAGWTAASQALSQAIEGAIRRPGAAGATAMAGNKPGGTGRRRGRPPKAATLEMPVVKRPRGRPRKSA